MLIIRTEQVRAFEGAAVRSFEDGMVEHLREFTPEFSAAMGETGLRALIRQGVTRAESYGFTEREPVRFIIELSLMFGVQFDTDPLLPWAEKLGDRSILHQGARAECLYDEVMEYVGAVAGPGHEYLFAAMRRAAQVHFEVAPNGKSNDAVVRWLRAIYPEKCELAGEARLRLLAQRGTVAAGERGIFSDAGRAIFVGCMFAFGHGFDDDPRFPFIAEVLNDDSLKDSDARAERLYAEAKNYLARSAAGYGKVADDVSGRVQQPA
jgi:hypothetical protein